MHKNLTRSVEIERNIRIYPHSMSHRNIKEPKSRSRK